MDEKITRAFINSNCVLGTQAGPQTIIVRQIIGEREAQRVLDIHVMVPERKPAIEQIIDVFVKNLRVLQIDVITDRIIIRGDLEVKAIYVADKPEQSVHAVEMRNCRFTQEVDIPGARRGMEADASISVEFVDYNVAEYTRAYKYKNYEHIVCCDDSDDYEDECEKPEMECANMGCANMGCANMDCVQEAEEEFCPPAKELAVRDFDVSIVLAIRAKVMADREIIIGGAQTPSQPMPSPSPSQPAPVQPSKKPAHKPAPKPSLPSKPKG